MNKLYAHFAIALSALFPSLGYCDSRWICHSDLKGTSAFERYIDVGYSTWTGEFESVAIGDKGNREIASAKTGQLAILADGTRQILHEGWPGGAIDVRVYLMSASIFDREAKAGTLVEKGTTNSGTTEVLFNCTRNEHDDVQSGDDRTGLDIDTGVSLNKATKLSRLAMTKQEKRND